ncbi:ashwin-like [Gigantopelta aegis]|uniref:ashwin-like n=1 Tax=Gigantopelta aegis TaxID=1735272 RepID=UPI001B88AB53|nr:ashwin-like [Gigantopelta aegis]
MSASIPSEIDWLYPELLTKDGLILILSQRYIQDANLGELDKQDLLDLYYKYIIPLPQRKYRPNRRGREMTKKQIILAKKRRLEWKDSEEPPAKKKSDIASSRFMSSFDPSSSQSRLKPPPSCVNFDKKVVKLGSGTKLSSPTNNSSSGSSVTGLTKKIVKITMDSSPSSETKPQDDKCKKTVSLKKTIKAINSHINTKDISPACKEEKPSAAENGGDDVEMKNVSSMVEKEETQFSDDSPKKKIKIKRISWP